MNIIVVFLRLKCSDSEEFGNLCKRGTSSEKYLHPFIFYFNKLNFNLS